MHIHFLNTLFLGKIELTVQKIKRVFKMKNLHSADELFSELNKMNKDNSVSQFLIPVKGKFTLVYQEVEKTIDEEIESDQELKNLIHESLAAYERGEYQTTSELLESLSKEKF